MFRFLKIFLFLILCSPVLAQQTSDVDVLPDFKDDSRAVLNDQLRRTNRRLMLLENGISLTTGVTGILPLANGGTARALTDPGADRILFWDESSNYFDWLTVGDWLSISGTTISGQTYVPNNIQVFTANGTWTKPSNISKVYVKVWGAGGNGGSADSSGHGGGGGGGGGYAEGVINVSSNVTVTVGTTAGATSSFAGDTTIQATGGSDGNYGPTQGVGGPGGSGSGGTINLTGSTGGSQSSSVAQGTGSSGGDSPMSGGGGSGGGGSTGSGGGFAGTAGMVPGGGGGGGGSQSGTGGSFAAGRVIVYY